MDTVRVVDTIPDPRLRDLLVGVHILPDSGLRRSDGAGHWTFFDALSQCEVPCNFPIDDPSCWCYVMDPIIVNGQ